MELLAALIITVILYGVLSRLNSEVSDIRRNMAKKEKVVIHHSAQGLSLNSGHSCFDMPYSGITFCEWCPGDRSL